MKVTGKELWGMQAEAMDEANARYLKEGHGSLSEMFWEVMAERLNGRNGEPIDACPLCHRRYEGRGDDGSWAKVEITDKSWKVKLLAEEERPKPEWMKDYKREFDSEFDKLLREQLDASRARHHATCPYRHGKGDCTC